MIRLWPDRNTDRQKIFKSADSDKGFVILLPADTALPAKEISSMVSASFATVPSEVVALADSLVAPVKATSNTSEPISSSTWGMVFTSFQVPDSSWIVPKCAAEFAQILIAIGGMNDYFSYTAYRIRGTSP